MRASAPARDGTLSPVVVYIYICLAVLEWVDVRCMDVLCARVAWGKR